MGQALEVVSGRVVNPGGALTALTANTGSSFTVRAAASGSDIFLVTLWTQQATAGEVRVRSARLHDQADGIRLRTGGARSGFLLPPAPGQELYTQDLLTVEQSGGGAETDFAAMLIYYRDLPGVAANLATWAEIGPRIVNYAGVRENANAAATAGDVAQPQVLTADQDTFKRNINYALLGIMTDVVAGLVGVIGADTGNLAVGIPSDNTLLNGPYGFATLSMYSGLPTIPIINGANIGATNMVLAHTTAAAAVNASYLFAELR